MKSLKGFLSMVRASGRAAGEGLSRRHLFTLSLPALAAGSVLGERTAEAAVADSRLDKILKARKLRVGTFLQYKPFSFKNEAGEPDGYDTDVAKALASDMGVQPEFVDNTWDGIIPALQADKFDVIIASMSNLKKRGLSISFTDPYNAALFAFVIRSADAARFSSLARFDDPKVTVSDLINDASHQTLERFFPKAKVMDFNSAEEAVLAVQTKKADCSAALLIFLNQYVKQHPGLTVKPIDYPGSSTLLAFALTPGPDNDHLKTFLNLWIHQFFWSGQYEPMYKKWFLGVPLPKIDKYMAPL